MDNVCLVTQYMRNLENAENSLRLGEVLVSVRPSKLLVVLWKNFNSNKDSIRVVSGNANVEAIVNGYNVTADASGCVIAVSNKYDIIRFNGSGTEVCYEVDANQFEWCENAFNAISRGKILGDIKYLQNDVIGYAQYMDFSEAEGNFDLAKVTNFNTVSLNNNVALIATGTFTQFGGYNAKYKTSPTPIPLNYCNYDGDDMSNEGPLWSGNIETDMRVSANYLRVRFDGNQVTGRLEKWIEKMIAVKSVGSNLRVLSKSSMTLNNTTLLNANFLFHFNSDTVTVTENNSATVIGTYTKATSTWSWV